MNDNDRYATQLFFKGRFDVVIRDKDGNIKHKGKLTAHNGIVNEGKDKLLGVMFNAATQITAWFIGLINIGPTLAASDTMLNHGGWNERHMDYDEATRPTWDEAVPSGQAITSLTVAVFTMNTTVTIAGFFLTSDAAKNGTLGTLWCTALFDGGEQDVVATDVIQVTYTLNG